MIDKELNLYLPVSTITDLLLQVQRDRKNLEYEVVLANQRKEEVKEIFENRYNGAVQRI